jgi:LuxR family maltose regulon positive regulatory protein
LAVVKHERNSTADAGRFLDLARCSGDLSGDTTLAGWKALIGSWLLLAEGNLGGAHEMLIEGRRQGCPMSSRHMQRWFAAAEAEVRTACGGAHAVPATLMPLLDDVEATSAPVAVALAHAYLRNGDIHAAARAVPHWSDETKSESFLALRLDAGLVEAVTASQLGDAPRATAALERVLRMSEPDGFRRVFVRGGQTVRDLLAKQLESGTAYWSLVRDLVDEPLAAAGEQERAASGPGEPLTEREVTVLRFLQSVLSNEEIASKMFVSVNTVKTHVRNIYRKLDVGRRREAVRRARELHLL